MAGARQIPLYFHEIAVGESISLDLTIKDPSGLIKDLTGYTSVYSFQNPAGTVTNTVVSHVANVLQVRVTPAVAADTYEHELRIKSAGGAETTLFRGFLRILPRIAEFA